MRSRFVLVALTLLLLGGSLPAAAAVVGSFSPVNGANTAYGQLGITGFALATAGVDTVDIAVDGGLVQRAIYGGARPATTRRYPGFPDSNAPGFSAFLDTTHFLNGKHTITVMVTDKNGAQTLLPVSRTVVFKNASHMDAPFGWITFPQADAVLRGNCNLADQFGLLSIITGNALDAGSGENAHDVGVGYVELLIDGALGFFSDDFQVLNTKVACRFSNQPNVNALLNCHGLPSRDVTFVYPTLPDSDRAKFRFALDVGALVGSKIYAPGAHTLTIRAGDKGQNVANIASINVFFDCVENGLGGPENAIGQIEKPFTWQPAAGTVTGSGWAIDPEGIAHIDIKVNGIPAGTATLTGTRPDVRELYLSIDPLLSRGFTFTYDTHGTNDGDVTFEVWVTDLAGNETLIGESTVNIDNRDHP
jgi:hypothetical protein